MINLEKNENIIWTIC